MWDNMLLYRFKEAVKAGGELEVKKCLKSVKKLVNKPFTSKNFPVEPIFLIHYVACFGTQGILAMFLTKFSETIEQVTESGKTALHLAVIFSKYENMQELINRGANIEAADITSRMTPLHFAVARKNIGAVKRLLDGMADTTIQDRDGETPVDIAKGNDCRQILKLFEKQIRELQTEERLHIVNEEKVELTRKSEVLETRLQEQAQELQQLKRAVQTVSSATLPPPVPPRKNLPSSKTSSALSLALETTPSNAKVEWWNSLHQPPIVNLNNFSPNPLSVHINVGGSQNQLGCDRTSGYNSLNDLTGNLTGAHFPIQAKTKIQKHFPDLVAYIRYKDIAPSLFAKGLLREDDMERLGKENLTNRDQMVFFFNEILFKCSSDGLRRFLEVLEENDYEYYADLIRNPDQLLKYLKDTPKLSHQSSVHRRSNSTQSTPAIPVGDFEPLISESEHTEHNAVF